MWTIDLTGHVALVVGGAGGIGSACVRVLAQAGAAVAIADLPSEHGTARGEALAAELRAAGHSVRAVGVDVTRDDSVQAMLDHVRASLGKPDIVVYSAGITDRVSLGDLTSDRWDRMIAVNLSGAYRVVRLALPDLLETRGTVVLVGSQVSMTGGGGGAHYAASKAGLEGLTRALCRELLPHGVRINTVQPCLIDTPMLRERYSEEEDLQALACQVPRGRLGRPEDIANAVLFLASEAADFICGQHLLVDGGRTFSQK
jgi:3-oxoacyl-[acyl-carrier protein] reductase